MISSITQIEIVSNRLYLGYLAPYVNRTDNTPRGPRVDESRRVEKVVLETGERVGNHIDPRNFKVIPTEIDTGKRYAKSV